jgi:hydrogenase maturation protease
MNAGALVVGLGSVDRGDDAVGLLVVRRIAALGREEIAVVECAEPTALIELWAGHDRVVVVDAVRSGAPAGTLHCRETGAGLPPLPSYFGSGPGPASTHAFGLAAVAELARALGRLPALLRVVGVEVTSFDHGAPLSPQVAACVDLAVAAVLDSLDRPVGQEAADVPG